MKYDAIVCGAGVQGLWTANHLVEKKKNVLLLEQFPFPHTRGSSQGPSRITRYSYPAAHHARMMLDAYELWQYLEDFYKSQLFVNCGLLSILSEELISATSNALDVINKNYEILNSSEITSRFAGISSLGYNGVYEKTGGVLKANKCLEALHRRFLSLGGTFFDCKKVQNIQPVNDQLVKVITNDGTFSAKTVVLTCGPWTNKILKPLHMQLPLMVKRIEVQYWQAKRPELFEARNNFPAIILKTSGKLAYSTPILEYPGLMKVCSHDGVDVDPEESDKYNRESAENFRRHMRSVVANSYPNLVPHVAVTEKCFYTVTPDKDFILDYHPSHRNIVIGAGFSGHGFKLAPVVGKILADLALGISPAHEMKHFSLKRFYKSSL